MLVQITASPFRFHWGTSQGKFGTVNPVYRMAAPVTSSGEHLWLCLRLRASSNSSGNSSSSHQQSYTPCQQASGQSMLYSCHDINIIHIFMHDRSSIACGQDTPCPAQPAAIINLLLNCLLLAGWPSPAQALSVVQAGQAFVTQPAGSSMHQQQRFQQPVQMQQQPAEYHDVSTTDSDSGSDCGTLRVPLKLVVQDAVKRWFNETLSEVGSGNAPHFSVLSAGLCAEHAFCPPMFAFITHFRQSIAQYQCHA